MPHVVLSGNVSMEDIFNRLKPVFVRNGGVILKTSNAYIEREKHTILVESLVIEGSKKANFFAMIGSRDGDTVIRIYPWFEVEKTNGVKRILAEISKQLLQIFPQLKVGKTNLTEYLQ